MLLYIAPLVISAVLGILLAYYIARNRPGLDGQALIGMLLGAAAWSAGYAMEFRSNEINTTSQILITTSAANHPPTSADASVRTLVNADYIFSLGDFPFSDLDGDNLTQIEIAGPAFSFGKLYLDLDPDGQVGDSEALLPGDTVFIQNLEDGSFKYKPDLSSGPVSDAFGFLVHDGTEYSVDSYTMTVKVDLFHAFIPLVMH